MIRFSPVAALVLLAASWLVNDAPGWVCGPLKMPQPYDWRPVADWWGKPYSARIRWHFEAPRLDPYGCGWPGQAFLYPAPYQVFQASPASPRFTQTYLGYYYDHLSYFR